MECYVGGVNRGGSNLLRYLSRGACFAQHTGVIDLGAGTLPLEDRPHVCFLFVAERKAAVRNQLVDFVRQRLFVLFVFFGVRRVVAADEFC